MLEKINYLTAGESHGRGLLGIIEGIPSNLEIDENFIREQLSRRQKGYGRGSRMKIESDFAQIYCGVRHGITIGAPIGLIIENKDFQNWEDAMSVHKNNYNRKITLPRPGHADLAGVLKYGFDDIRNVIERSSARETAMRVAIGAICRKLLSELSIDICSRVVQIFNIVDKSQIDSDLSYEKINELADQSSVRCLDKDKEKKMIDAISIAKKKGDSVGGVFEIYCKGLPYGLGGYSQWYQKLQSKISETMLSINAFKGIEFGAGFSASEKYGSQIHDEITFKDNLFHRQSNNAGGIEGGMSNAQPISIRLSMKPIPTLVKPLKSVDIISKSPELAHKERTDSCAVPAASIIAENLLSIVVADSILSKFGGDSLDQIKSHMKASAQY